jgi:hypothetical protein
MPGGGGLMSLIAYGAQDVYLIQPPCCGICYQSLEKGCWCEKIKDWQHSGFTKRSVALHKYNNYKKSYHEICKNVVTEELGKYVCQDLVLTIVGHLIDKR